ncbi:hypothetical protein AB4552_18240 [Vibrio sp. 10N.222.54.C3]|uniref:hypothetical protein n=1 Tax=Vibrio sp. 10N.222.54.C3 TaxID=3229640 RepID=UPI00354C049A
MKYPEYLHSAKRHNYACRLLQEKLASFDVQDQNSDNFKHVVCSLYYLSGYIIECSLKFKIFECCNYDSVSEIESEKCKEHGINYRKKIKTHSFTTLQNFLSSKVSEISYESNESHLSLLLDNWTPEVRYESRNLDHDEVIELYMHAKKFLRQM